MTSARRKWFVAIVLAGASSLSSGHGFAQTTEGPGIAVSATDITPGDRVIVTMGRFDASQVTISVCGNNALRGSSDCNMPESEGVALRLDDVSTLAEIPVAAPPVPCPCVIRVSTSDNQQVAFAPINLIGHPTAPLTPVEQLTDPLDVRVSVDRAPSPMLDKIRSSVGGAATYEVVVTIRNKSSASFSNVQVAGSAGRSPGEELVRLAFEGPGPLEPGQTWTGSTQALLPALTFGDVEWRATAFGAGSPITVTNETTRTPWLLWILGAILVLDLSILLIRFIMRRARRGRSEPDDNPFLNDPHAGPDSDTEADVVDSQRERQLVG